MNARGRGRGIDRGRARDVRAHAGVRVRVNRAHRRSCGLTPMRALHATPCARVRGEPSRAGAQTRARGCDARVAGRYATRMTTVGSFGVRALTDARRVASAGGGSGTRLGDDTRRRVRTSESAVANPSMAGVDDAPSSSTQKIKVNPRASKPAPKKKDKAALEADRDFCRMVTRYDPEEIQREALARPFELAKRTAHLAFVLGKLKNKQQSLEALDALDGGSRWANAVKETLCELGPLFVKLGQNLANRPDLVNETLMEELTKLQDRVPPFDSKEAFKIIEEQTGKTIEETFSEISPEPIAAASIGQVYKGKLKSDGQEVAIKVLRPNTRTQCVLDLFLLRAAALKFFDEYSTANLGCSSALLVDEFAEKLLEELDFVQEARNLRDFKFNFRNDSHVQIPAVVSDLSGPRVLVMHWQTGVRCTAQGAFENDAARARFLVNGVEAGLKQLLEFGLFHGDPHPGNVLAIRNGDIAYVDFGNVAEISRSNQESLIDAVVHVMNRDYDALAETLSDLGFLQPGSDVGPVAEGLAEVWGDEALQSLASAEKFSFRGLTREFNKLLFKYPIRVPERFSLVIRSLLTQESICLTLNPDFNLLDAAFPYVARRLLTDPDPALRLRLLKVVVVKERFEWERLRNLISLAGVGVKGGIKVPILALAKDAAHMLATDKELRKELYTGLRAVTLAEHFKESFSLGCVLLSIAVGRLTQPFFDVARQILRRFRRRVRRRFVSKQSTAVSPA